MTGPSLFTCPVCGGPLTAQMQPGASRPKALRCAAGHSFDLAREGYVNLLATGRRHSKQPGDSPDMVAARRAFLAQGHYDPFAQALARLCLALSEGQQAPALLDAGCGEGMYTLAVARAFAQAGRRAHLAGFDISKAAVRAAAKADRDALVQWAVAGSFAIPAADGAFSLVTNIFSPMVACQFARVLAPGGALIYAVPGPRHLWQLKQVLYDTPYENPVRDVAYPGFRLEQRISVPTLVHARGPAVRWLFAMTPYYWKTPRDGAARLDKLEALDTEAQFDFCVYRKL